MDGAKDACCLLKLFSSNVEDFGNWTVARHLMACCLQRKPHHQVGKIVENSTEKGSSGSEMLKEKFVHRPIVHLDSVKEWNVNESLYVIGLSAWHFVKPYVAFFSHDLSLKVGTVRPHLFHGPLRRNLVLHVMEGFPHEEMGVTFEKTNKVWLRIPIRCDKPFQSLVMDVFGLFVYKTFCTPHSGMGDFGFWNVIGNVSSSRVVFGVESDEAAATYFAGLDGYGDDSSQQFTSNSIFQPNDTEVETEPAELVRGRPGGHKVVETAASQLSVCNVVDELSMQMIKEEIKDEPESAPEVMPCTQESHKESIRKTSAFPTVKCPGCASSFHASKSGLDALSHHILNSHKRRAKLYRLSLRFSVQGGQGSHSNRVNSLKNSALLNRRLFQRF